MCAATAIPAALYCGWQAEADRAGRRQAYCFAAAALGLLAATLAFGVVRQRQWDAWCAAQPKLKIGLVQVDPAYMGSEQKLRDRSLPLHDHVDLLCWPESSLGIYNEKLTHFRDPAKTILLSRDSQNSLQPAEGFACHLLAGGKLYRDGAADEGPYAMTAFLISPAQDIVGRYRKRTLLPFGEYIPGQSWYPAVREYATLRDVVEAGADPGPMVTTAGHRLGLVICYEDTLPRNARHTVAAGAEALFSIIQGTAFENPLTLVQHQRLAALRAVENRRYFVRCASTGVTCVIDPTGRTIAELPPQVEGTLVTEIALNRSRTVYNRFGHLFPWLCTAIGGVGLWRLRTRRTSLR
jgi:apolipoprotein N-acyltransferase